MKVHFVWMGKTRDEHCAALQADYLKRIGRYTSVELSELKESKGSEDESRIRQAEAEKLLEAVRSDDFVVLLDEGGRELTSREWSEFLKLKQDTGTRRLAFIIGGFSGVDEAVRKRADLTVALARMTLTHELARVLLTEQIYRAHSILAGSPYHRA